MPMCVLDSCLTAVAILSPWETPKKYSVRIIFIYPKCNKVAIDGVDCYAHLVLLKGVDSLQKYLLSEEVSLKYVILPLDFYLSFQFVILPPYPYVKRYGNTMNELRQR